MSFTLFSATGCSRCKIVKEYMDENGLKFDEQDMKAAGKDNFKKFYKENRPRIFRGDEGIEFPILFTENKIFQGVGVILGFLKAEDLLKGPVIRSDLSHGWISGLNVSAKGLENQEAFVEILEFVKKHGLSIQLEADGRNAALLDTIIKKKLVTRLVFYLRGPADLYEKITGIALEEEELKYSLSLINDSFEYRIIMPVSPMLRTNLNYGYLTAEEAMSAARLVEQATGSKKHPFFIEPVMPPEESGLDPLPSSAFFKYRTACRRHIVLAEIQK